MGELILVVQADKPSPSRELQDLGLRIFERSGVDSDRLFFIRTNSGVAYTSTSSLQTSIRTSEFDGGHTKVRILLDEAYHKSYAGMETLLETEVFRKRTNALAVLVASREFCIGLLSHLLPSHRAEEFDWSLGKAVIVHLTQDIRAAEQC